MSTNATNLTLYSQYQGYETAFVTQKYSCQRIFKCINPFCRLALLVAETICHANALIGVGLENECSFSLLTYSYIYVAMPLNRKVIQRSLVKLNLGIFSQHLNRKWVQLSLFVKRDNKATNGSTCITHLMQSRNLLSVFCSLASP